jgi:OmcA/MtrC family decaheme c-type cytochrome
VTSASTDLQKYSASPYVSLGTNYGSGFSVNAATGVATQAAATTLVSSPTAAACFGCHDSSLAQSHMTSNGGAIYEPRSTALLKVEQCLLCHATGRVADIKEMHSK